MTNDIATIDPQVDEIDRQGTETEYWADTQADRTRGLLPRSLRGPFLSLAIVLSASPATSVADLTSLERRKRDAITVPWELSLVIGRPISRNYALRLAREILENAENRRIEFAKWEAGRGIQWDDQT